MHLRVQSNPQANLCTKYSFIQSVPQTHNKLMNKILLVSEKDLDLTIRQILSHFLNLAQVKNSTSTVIGLLTKFIDFLKFYEKAITTKYLKTLSTAQKSGNKPKKQQQNSTLSLKKMRSNELSQSLTNQNPQQTMQQMLQLVVDIILLIQNKSRQGDTETFLRIIQTTFSLIDIQFIQYMSFNLLTKIFSISFQCCHVNAILQNISVSCLFSLTETLFCCEKKEKESHMVLQNFLEFLFRSKKFSWIKDADLKGLVWDLVVAGVRNQDEKSLERFADKQSNVQLLNIMYKLSAEFAFSPKGFPQKQPPAKQTKKSNTNEVSMSFRHDLTSQFIRYYKAFVVLSTQYSLMNLKLNPPKQQIVPFKDNVRLFNLVYDLQRNWRMYILLQGMFSLIDKYPQFPVNEDKGYILLQVVSKIAEQLCLCNQKIPCQWNNQKSFLNKFYAGDLWTINDGDFVKIIRNSMISMRKKFQYMKSKEGEWWFTKAAEMDKSMTTENTNSERSDNGSKSQSQSTARKRWEKFIKCIIKIIRYLSSISILSETDEQPVRKIILELQHWFLICPSTKIKNLILQQLLITTSTLTTKQQAIKISQCIQIGSNLIYGYYDMLDSIGLTIIMKMMAGIKASKQQGKQFQQLQEVFNMSQKLYLQQKIVKTQKQFSTTIQAFVQCSNSLVADLQQPQNPLKVPALGKNPAQRYYKMIEYLLEKLNIVILQNRDYLFDEWNFLTGFWMSFCSNKNHEIQCKTIVYVGEVVQKLLQIFKNRQQQVISIYLELSAKCTTKKDLKIEYHIIAQIKNYIPLLQNEQALMETFKIIKILQTQVKTNTQQKLHNPNLTEQKKFMLELSQLQEAFIKEGIHRINKLPNLVTIIQGIEVLGNEKNEEYKILTLLWTVADHLRNLSSLFENSDQPTKTQYQQLWKQIFQKIQTISSVSNNAETKQCSIHTFTQIIAESSPLINDQILIQLYEKIFIQSLFVALMQNHTLFHDHMASIDMSLKVDMVKGATKNYLKLTKKFILQNIFTDPYKKIEFTVDKMIKYLQKLNSTESKEVLPVEIMYQFLVFAQKLINKESIDLKYVNKQLIGNIFCELQKMGSKIDQTTIIWRKKYLPHFNQVKQNFNKLLANEQTNNPPLQSQIQQEEGPNNQS